MIDAQQPPCGADARGQAFLAEARALLAQAERTSAIAARVQRGELGVLRLGFTSAAALTPAIPRLILVYRQPWPGVHLRIAELTTQEQLSAMLERRLDCAFVRGTQTPDLPAHLAAIRLVDDALIAVFPQRHGLAKSRAAISVSALAAEPFVMYLRESGVAVYEQIIALCLRAGFSPHAVQEAHAVATIMGLVAAGLGIALVPESFSHIGVNGVVHRPLREKEAKSAMCRCKSSTSES